MVDPAVCIWCKAHGCHHPTCPIGYPRGKRKRRLGEKVGDFVEEFIDTISDFIEDLLKG